MSKRILITGSSGLVGTALRNSLASLGFEVVGLDLRATDTEAGNVRDAARVGDAVRGCDGVVHLAAVSRVVWGENNPALCQATNVGGLQNVLSAVFLEEKRPWVIFGSSREVYGQPELLPATEETSLRPMNIYARTKVEGEQLIAMARKEGLRAMVIRLSNVFGSTFDHADRVIPAFARAAVLGHTLRVDGDGHTFDFTHIDDVTRGLVALIQLLQDGADAQPPIHLVSGKPTTLGQLARMAIDIAVSSSTVSHASPRNFDVERFYGSPERAGRLLAWAPRVSLIEGLTRLISDFRTVQSVDALQGSGS